MTQLVLTPLIPGTLGVAAAAGTSLTAQHLSPGSLAATAATEAPTGIFPLYSTTYGVGYSFGNVDAFWYAGAGGGGSFAPWQVYQRFGEASPGSPVTKTTQGGAINAVYYGPPTDDSSEGFSVFVNLHDVGAGFTSTNPHTAFEAIAQVEGANIVSGASVVGVGSRINLTGTSSASTIEFFHMALNATGGGGGTATTAYGLRQLATFGATTNFGAYLVDPVYSETSLRVTKSGNGMDFRVDLNGPSAFVYAKNPDGQTTQTTVRVDAIASQTASLMEFHDTSGNTAATVSAAGGFISQSGVGFIANKSGVSRMAINRDGLFWIDSALEQTTVGAAGGASALPATPTKYLKVQDHNGTVLVIPAYAAS